MRAPWFCDGPWRGLPKGLTFHQLVSTSSPKRPKITVDVIIAKIRLGKTTSYRWVSATQLSRADHKIYSCTIILDFDLKSLQMRRDMPDTRFKKVYTFNSARKSMSTIIPLDTGGFRWQKHTNAQKTCVKLFPCQGVHERGVRDCDEEMQFPVVWEWQGWQLHRPSPGQVVILYLCFCQRHFLSLPCFL